MDDSKLIIDTPAIVELFGHTKMAGHITSIVVGSSAFFRVEVPKTKKQEGFTRMLNPAAIYAINPCTEEVMLAMANSFNFTPISPWDLPESLKKPALPEASEDDDDGDEAPDHNMHEYPHTERLDDQDDAPPWMERTNDERE